jgi:hypothetical protein
MHSQIGHVLRDKIEDSRVGDVQLLHEVDDHHFAVSKVRKTVSK